MRPSIRHIVVQLAAARRDKGISQQAVGRKIGIPQSHISKIEAGIVDVGLSTLIQLARVLDLEIMLVPRQLIPAVRSMQQADRAGRPSESEREQPAYHLDEEDES